MALQDYDRAVELSPQFVDAFINRAALLVDVDLERSLADIEEALRNAPDNPMVQINVGAILDRLGNFADAERHLTEAIRLDSTSALAYANRALSRQHQQRYDEALEDFEKSLDIEKDAETLMNRAGLHFERQDFQQAIADYSEALAIAPVQLAPVLYTQRGMVYARIGEPERAVEDCEKALEINPDLAQALVVRGSARTNLNDPLRALADFSMALQIGGPPSMRAMLYHNRGFQLHRMGDLRGALDDFNRALVLNPDSAQALNARADLYIARGEFEAALRDVEEAIKMAPNAANLHNTRGRALRYLKRYDEAIEAYTKAIRLNPNSPTSYGNRGELFQALGEHDHALADYNRCLEIEPHDGGYLLNRADLYRAEGRFEAAMEDAEQALAVDEGLAVRYHAVKGLIFAAQEKYAEAVESFTENLILRPDQSRGYLYRAESEVQLDMFDVALRDAETARRRGLEDADDLYRLSRVYAQLSGKLSARDGQRQKTLVQSAIESLSRAIDAGFSDLDRVKSDEAWSSLRSCIGFREVTDRLKKGVEDQE